MINPLVSIITPSYNQASFLEETIDSVINQDYEKIEYIIVDGGSTDGSDNIIEQYSKKIAYWVSEPDLGQSHAINKGLGLAKGEIVCWLNSDDLFFPHSVSKAVNSFQNYPKAGMVYANCLEIDKNGEILAVTKVRQYCLLDLLTFNIIPQPTVFLRRDLVMEIKGLNQSLNLLFDHEMWIRMATKAPIHYEDQLWAKARIHDESKNTVHWQGFGQEANTIIMNMMTDSTCRQVINSHYKQIQAGKACFTGNYALGNGDFHSALKELMRALLLYPTFLIRILKQLIILTVMIIGKIHTRKQFNALRRRFRAIAFSNNISKLRN
jgi:glycosyltransferase involved in cell wall biosynthesis